MKANWMVNTQERKSLRYAHFPTTKVNMVKVTEHITPIVDTHPSTCYHCKEALPKSVIQFDQKEFCCEGCSTVYKLLIDNNLCTYYQLDPKPGTKQLKKQEYGYLEDPSTIEKLIDFQDETVTKVTFFLPQIHCSSCIWLLENLHRLHPSIFKSTVHFPNRQATIFFAHQEISLRQVAESMASVGYAPEINFGDVTHTKKSKVDRTLYYQLALSFFAFGNIMLLSFPEYFGIQTSAEVGFSKYFGWINLAIATPVLLYSAKDYLSSAWHGLRQGHLNIDVPLSLGIIALFGRSAYEVISVTGSGYFDSFAGLIFFLLAGKWFQQRTYQHLSFDRNYTSYFPIAANVLKNGVSVSTPIDQLQMGDVLRIRHQELIPADGVILQGQGKIDYSFVTGEAIPVEKNQKEAIFAGGRQMGSAIEMVLTKRVAQSYLTQMWNNEAFSVEKKSHISLLADKAGRYFTFVILAIAMGTFGYWALQGNMGTAINAATAVLIIACPCAVALAIPFTMGNLMSILGRNAFYVKNTQVIEHLDKVDAIVFDKTGTITQNTQQNTDFKGHLSPEETSMVYSLAMQSNHPLSIRIAQQFDGAALLPLQNFKATVGQGIEASIQGKRIRIGNATFIHQDPKSIESLAAAYVAIDDDTKGHFIETTTYRKGFEKVFQAFQQMGKQVYILSGDNDKEREFLAQYIPLQQLHFHQSPTDKLTFIESLQAKGQKVLMVGDGLNDAGALQKADIGIVISENTNNFSPACDAILQADRFPLLPKFLHLSKQGSLIVGQAYFLALCYNVVGLSYAVTGQLSPVIAAILMPLSAITIVLFGVFKSSWVGKKLFPTV